MNNMTIWDQVKKTDPAATKEYSGPGGYSGTSINGQYMVMMATKVFGPIGIGWGYEIVEERYDIGGLIEVQDDHEIRSMTHTIRLKLWYKINDERGEVEHFGHTPYVFKTRNGSMTDPEAPKKSLTDAMKKCLSMLGFAADIFLGQYDDVVYREELADEFSIVKAENKDDEIARQRNIYLEKMEKYATQMDDAVTKAELLALFKEAVRKAGYQKDDKMVRRLTEIKDKNLIRFEGVQK